MKSFVLLMSLLLVSACAARPVIMRGQGARPVPAQFGHLDELLYAEDVTAGDLTAYMAALSPEDRADEATHLNRDRLEVLWRLSEHNKAYTADELVPPGTPALSEVPYDGQNSLLVYRKFQKVFYRQSDGTVAGLNVSDAEWLAGPGYYTVSTDATGIFVDYTVAPYEKPDGRPDLENNRALIYGGMKDYLRRVYGDVLIGRAYDADDDEPTDNYFVLARP